MRAEDFLVYKLCLKIALSQIFNYFIQTCIIINTIILSLDRHPISKKEEEVHVYFHNILASIFLVELLIKILGLGFRTYWKELFNRFDCVIVLLSAVDMLVTYGL